LRKILASFAVKDQPKLTAKDAKRSAKSAKETLFSDNSLFFNDSYPELTLFIIEIGFECKMKTKSGKFSKIFRFLF